MTPVMRNASAVAAVVVLAITSLACDENLSTITGPTPNLVPTLTSIQQDIFSTADAAGRAPCTTCHTNVGRNPSGQLNLAPGFSHAQLVNRGSVAKSGAVLVVPGDPDNSYLIHKL